AVYGIQQSPTLSPLSHRRAWLRGSWKSSFSKLTLIIRPAFLKPPVRWWLARLKPCGSPATIRSRPRSTRFLLRRKRAEFRFSPLCPPIRNVAHSLILEPIFRRRGGLPGNWRLISFGAPTPPLYRGEIFGQGDSPSIRSPPPPPNSPAHS